MCIAVEEYRVLGVLSSKYFLSNNNPSHPSILVILVVADAIDVLSGVEGLHINSRRSSGLSGLVPLKRDFKLCDLI